MSDLFDRMQAVGSSVMGVGQGRGAAGPTTTVAGTSSGTVLRTPRNDAAAKAYIYENYPVFAGFLNDPEIGPLLMEAGYDKWELTKLQAKLFSTNWWRKHSEAERNYEMAAQSDPAELERQVAAKQAEVWDWAMQMGVSGAEVGEIARNALRYGWSDAQTRDVVSGLITASSLSGANSVHTLVDQARASAADYFVKTTDDEALVQARRVMAGEINAEDIRGIYSDRAKELYAHLAPVIDQGISLKSYFEPHRQQIAQLLEVNPDSVDFQNDTRWQQLTRVQNQDGTYRAASLTEAADMARKAPEWAKTQNAQDGAADMALKLAKMFGGI